MKIRTIIVDDEQDSRDVLKLLLSKHFPEVDIIGQASTTAEGKALIAADLPDLVLLDVEMPEENGIELLRSYNEKPFYTIFVTGYQNYAIDALREAALDYILKPVDLDELRNAIENLKLKINAKASKEEWGKDQLIISTGNGFRSIAHARISHIVAKSGNYCFINLLDGEHVVVTKTLTHFEEALNAYGFYRIHRGYLVNLRAVSSYNSQSGVIGLKDGTELPLATRKRSDFKQAFQAFRE